MVPSLNSNNWLSNSIICLLYGLKLGTRIYVCSMILNVPKFNTKTLLMEFDAASIEFRRALDTFQLFCLYIGLTKTKQKWAIEGRKTDKYSAQERRTGTLHCHHKWQTHFLLHIFCLTKKWLSLLFYFYDVESRNSKIDEE